MSDVNKTGQDVVAEGIWLTAEMMDRMLRNQHTGGSAMTETIWKCDQLRAGRLYNSNVFDTQAEAKSFAEKMSRMEPDQVFSIEAIEASQVWN